MIQLPDDISDSMRLLLIQLVGDIEELVVDNKLLHTRINDLEVKLGRLKEKQVKK